VTAPVAPVVAPYRSPQPAGRDGFAQLVHAEWTKLRTVRGWLIGLFLVIVVTDLLGIFGGGYSHAVCITGPGAKPQTGAACTPKIPTGPGGEAVHDTYYLVGQVLAGNGTLTARVTSLATEHGIPSGPQGQNTSLRPAPVAWAKSGIIITASTRPGAAYAAMMVTQGHGVRMQYDYTGDTAGRPGAASAASPRWLRLTRAGDTVTGYDSADGVHWATVGTVRLPGLASTVRAGLFAAAPDWEQSTTNFGGGENGQGGPSLATATLDRISASGGWATGRWQGTAVGGPDLAQVGYQQGGGRFTVRGSGDIAPMVPGAGGREQTIEQHLIGVFAGLIVVIMVAVLFITVEYRRGLIRTTLTASPRRGRVLAAKALVIGTVTFVAGLIAAVIAVIGGVAVVHSQFGYVYPVTGLTWVRVVAGSALLLAVAAVLAVAVGSILRRTAAAVTVGVVVLVLPYILGVAAILPGGAAQWVLRITPAAAFAIQQSIPAYPQVDNLYLPTTGYYPLAPWAGFAVLCGWTALAFGLAVVLIRRRDA
jgi:ABC-type transport system involved in multi-copper enzyme maturation permease subunit